MSNEKKFNMRPYLILEGFNKGQRGPNHGWGALKLDGP